MKVGICTGGGDCPGLNAVIRGAVKHAIGTYGMEIWGIKDSFNGLMSRPYDVRKLSGHDVSEILFRGGTILGTTNSGNPFSLKNSNNNQTSDKSQLVVEAYKDLGLDCIIVVGGDGTQGIGWQLSQVGINVVGIPKTIDNDLIATDLTVGFDTAVEIAADATSRLRSTAESHDRLMILEVMGRHAGHIALHAGVAGGAHIILLPEIPFDYDAIVKKIEERKKMGRYFSVIVVAEGAFPKGGQPVFSKSASGAQNLGGIGNQVAHELHARTKIDTRVTVLGHVQRGGTPSSMDRILGTAFGVHAVDLVHQKAYGKIVALQGNQITAINYKDVAGKFRPLDQNDYVLKTAESIGICLGRATKFQTQRAGA